MRTNELIIDNLMNSSIINEKGLDKEEVRELIKEYHDSILSVLLSNGYVKVSEDISLRVVKLKDRIYVLRGNPYNNHRKYKLKMIVSNSVYKNIEESYNLLVD